MSGSGSLSLHEVSVCWKIPNFRNITSDSIFSERFSSIRGSWCMLQCYPRGVTKESVSTQIGIMFTSDITVSFELALLDCMNRKFKSTRISGMSFKQNVYSYFMTIDRMELLESSELPIETLTICFTVCSFPAIDGYIEQNSRLMEVTNYLQNLFKNGEHSDVSIVVGCKVFPAHKCILGERSQVFQAMFSHNMKENNENKVIIIDLQENAVEQMLLYMYTGNSPKLDEMPEELYTAADKYALDKLKEMCEQSMSRNLRVENTCKWYLFGCQNNLETLKVRAEEFVSDADNMKSVMDSPSFDEVIASHPDVIKKLMYSYVKQKVESKKECTTCKDITFDSSLLSPQVFNCGIDYSSSD